MISVEALFAGPIPGASMNPARSIAPAIISGEISHLYYYPVKTSFSGRIFCYFHRSGSSIWLRQLAALWIYIAAPVLGSILAVLCCRKIKETI